jgi:hypothetical protein
LPSGDKPFTIWLRDEWYLGDYLNL